VVAIDGSHKSKEPMPKDKAMAQMRALYANVKDVRGGADEERGKGNYCSSISSIPSDNPGLIHAKFHHNNQKARANPKPYINKMARRVAAYQEAKGDTSPKSEGSTSPRSPRAIVPIVTGSGNKYKGGAFPRIHYKELDDIDDEITHEGEGDDAKSRALVKKGCELILKYNSNNDANDADIIAHANAVITNHIYNIDLNRAITLFRYAFMLLGDSLYPPIPKLSMIRNRELGKGKGKTGKGNTISNALKDFSGVKIAPLPFRAPDGSVWDLYHPEPGVIDMRMMTPSPQRTPSSSPRASPRVLPEPPEPPKPRGFYTEDERRRYERQTKGAKERIDRERKARYEDDYSKYLEAVAAYNAQHGTNIEPHPPLSGRRMIGGSWLNFINPVKIYNEIANPDSILRRRVADVSKGIRTDYAPHSRKILEIYGNEMIEAMALRRTVVKPALNSALQIVTLGQWNPARAEANIDKIFHLGLVLTVRKDGQRVFLLVEKNEVVNLAITSQTVKGAEGIKVLPPLHTSLRRFLDRGLDAVGGDRFFKYDAFENNCQDFIAMLLSANGVYTPDAQKFVKQPAELLLSKLPSWTQTVTRGITDAAGIGNVVLEGGFAGSPTPPNPLSRAQYLSRVRAKARAAGYPYKLLGYSDDKIHKFQIPNESGKIIRFGRVGYGDYIIWSALEASGKAKKGMANQKRRVFHNSHSKIKGDWRSDLFSPNNLALKILW
jgi:hypothetical protein